MNRFLLVTGGVLALAATALAQDMSTSWKHTSDRTKCEDLVITSSDYEIARSEQQLTVDPKDAAQLTLDGSKNGGIYISGWDQPGYQVLACKAAFAQTLPEAQQILGGVAVARKGSQISSTGPHDRKWVISFIVHVPHKADLTASTYNGPVSLQDADGRLNIKSYNGPLSIKHFSGDLTGETHNGPVNYSGNGGNVNLTTVNGPVNLRLEASEWKGDLSASTDNGPVNLRVPDNFTSAFLVEGGNGPMSCSSSLCGKASKVYERGDRRIEFGSSPRIKASTQNGPVRVADIHGDI